MKIQLAYGELKNDAQDLLEHQLLNIFECLEITFNLDLVQNNDSQEPFVRKMLLVFLIEQSKGM